MKLLQKNMENLEKHSKLLQVEGVVSEERMLHLSVGIIYSEIIRKQYTLEVLVNSFENWVALVCSETFYCEDGITLHVSMKRVNLC